MSTTKEADTKRITQAEMNPLVAVIVKKDKGVDWVLNREKLKFKPFHTVENDKDVCGVEVYVGDRKFGSVFFDPIENVWFHFGLKQQKLNGGEDADQVGKRKEFDKAVIAMLESDHHEQVKAAKEAA